MRWWRRKQKDDDLKRELQAHLELEEAEHREAGLSADEAQFAARRALGNRTRIQEDVRQVWGWTWLEALLTDLRVGIRRLKKSPGFALASVITLGLGIGAGTAVFTLVNSVLLEPLVYRESDRLMVAWEHVRFLGGDAVGPNPRHVDLWARRAKAVTGFASFSQGVRAVSPEGQATQIAGTVVCTPNLFDLLEVRPLLGRTFRAGEGARGEPATAVLTHAAWQSWFGGRADILGRTIRVEEAPVEVVGILPPEFQFPNANALRAFPSGQPKSGVREPAIFRPVQFNYGAMEWNGNYGNWVTLTRLRNGVTAAAAEAELNTVQGQVLGEMPAGQIGKQPGELRASLRPMQDVMVGDARSGLWLLMASVGGLLLLACLNLANAQLGRALSGSRDTALRAALGAARLRLLSSALAESLILAGTGGLLGVGLAAAGLAAFQRYAPVDLPRLSEVHLNGKVLLFSLLMTLAACLLAGLLPALRTLKTDPHSAMQQGSARTHGSRSSHAARSWLIGFQVFGCTALLLVTGLFVRSLVHLLNQDKGFETAHVAVAELRLPPKYYQKEADRVAIIDSLLQGLRALPDVESAAYMSAMPLEGESWVEFAGRPDRPEQKGPMVNARWVSAGYFETTRQRLLAGRFFEERDRGRDVAILSEGEAAALWGQEDPIGGQVKLLGKTFHVIGVVADSKSASLKTAPVRMAYVQYTYRTPANMLFVVRAREAASAVVPAMRAIVQQRTPDIAVARIKTLDAQLRDSLARERFQTFVLSAFGAAALALAMVGIYSVLSYAVAARRQEIGVRMALGARRTSIYRLTVEVASRPVLSGLLAGVIASVAGRRLVENSLFGTKAIDPALVAAVVLLFLAAATLAAFLPARRAACIDPMEALRPE
ncbi:MAG: ABC transporter permease [Bryobacterales bacterium]|nr:ABC transporter permease [Bryobacterales bacterium]